MMSCERREIDRKFCHAQSDTTADFSALQVSASFSSSSLSSPSTRFFHYINYIIHSYMPRLQIKFLFFVVCARNKINFFFLFSLFSLIDIVNINLPSEMSVGEEKKKSHCGFHLDVRRSNMPKNSSSMAWIKSPRVEELENTLLKFIPMQMIRVRFHSHRCRLAEKIDPKLRQFTLIQFTIWHCSASRCDANIPAWVAMTIKSFELRFFSFIVSTIIRHLASTNIPFYSPFNRPDLDFFTKSFRFTQRHPPRSIHSNRPMRLRDKPTTSWWIAPPSTIAKGYFFFSFRS